MTHNDDAI